MTHGKSDEAPGPDTRDNPGAPARPASSEPVEVLELTDMLEVTELVELVELVELRDLVEPPAQHVRAEQPENTENTEPPPPPEPSALPAQAPEQPALPAQPEPDDFSTLFDDPQQTRAELTALRAANHELVRINERLANTVEQRTADMLASRDAQAQFIADVNRQVRGPLDAILGYSELLTEDLTDLELHDLAHDVEKIRSAGESLLDLLGRMVERRRLDGG